MARIPSPNPDFSPIQVPGAPGYVHPIETRSAVAPSPTTVNPSTTTAPTNPRPIPMAFQVASPFNRWVALMPHALVLHVNPSSLQESHTQKIERIQTRGGFVEQHWGHELVSLSADASTGAFMNIRTGLTSVLRQRTIAWDRFRDLHDLFRNNGSVYDPSGNIVLQGNIILMYDRGIYFGGFRSFDWEDTAESPFAFKLNWTFKVEQTVMDIDVTASRITTPSFQGLNTQGQPGGSAVNPTNTQNTVETQSQVQAPQPGGSVQLGSGLSTPGLI